MRKYINKKALHMVAPYLITKVYHMYAFRVKFFGIATIIRSIKIEGILYVYI